MHWLRCPVRYRLPPDRGPNRATDSLADRFADVITNYFPLLFAVTCGEFIDIFGVMWQLPSHAVEPERSRESAEVEKWIVEARQGSRETLGRLLEMCRHYLLLAANNKLAPALRAKVAPFDIVQDTLLVAGRDFLRFHGSGEEELLAWLRGILHNIVADTYRHYTTDKRQVAREVPLVEMPRAEMLLDPGESPSGWAQARERDAQLEKALQQLPEHYRQVLRMCTKDGLTFVQIAEKLGGTADAVRKLWRRAVEELAKHLDALFESA